jgi:DNA-binding MurR/RpiR family transcriptional regulator
LNRIVAETVSCRFFDNQHIAQLLKQSNMVKQCGIAPAAVMRFVFSLAFAGKTLFRYLQAGGATGDTGKDTVYRFFNSVNVNWRKFFHLLCASMLNKKILPLTSV